MWTRKRLYEYSRISYRGRFYSRLRRNSPSGIGRLYRGEDCTERKGSDSAERGRARVGEDSTVEREESDNAGAEEDSTAGHVGFGTF